MAPNDYEGAGVLLMYEDDKGKNNIIQGVQKGISKIGHEFIIDLLIFDSVDTLSLNNEHEPPSYSKPHIHVKGDIRNVHEKKASELNDTLNISIWSLQIYSHQYSSR